ncbi:MAG: hypothetical protein KAX78_03455 [Phycisphaerae bacterium]|nr:hypothetical protein [Phycisphaerae bacterium]
MGALFSSIIGPDTKNRPDSLQAHLTRCGPGAKNPIEGGAAHAIAKAPATFVLSLAYLFEEFGDEQIKPPAAGG